MTDISDYIGAEEMPCCPLCGNEITEFEPVVLATAHGGKGLVHYLCVEEFDDEDEGDA